MTATTAAANTASAGKVWRQCGKCRGTGRLPEYGHVAGGSCFPCAGSGEVLAPAALARARGPRRKAAPA